MSGVLAEDQPHAVSERTETPGGLTLQEDEVLPGVESGTPHPKATGYAGRLDTPLPNGYEYGNRAPEARQKENRVTDPSLPAPAPEKAAPSDFIRDAVVDDLKIGRFTYVRTRWPPEPNGYLHIGHAKAICLDFGIASEFKGNCNFRFDDTNPEKEEQEYVDAITADVRWLGFPSWGDREFFASDYFEQLYAWAEQLIRAGKAYVCDLSEQEIREYRGTDVADKGPNRRSILSGDSRDF